MIFIFGDCEIDVTRRELRRAGSASHVEPQVFDLLVHLVTHRDRVVDKEELLGAVWGGRTVSESTLSSRISAARRAIGDSGDRQKWLRTVARRGFRFHGEVTEREPTRTPCALAFGGRGLPPSAAPVSPPTRAEQPGIAVLPFANLSGDPAQERFADGIVEDLITGLGKVRWLRVMARSSSFRYKGRAGDPSHVACELGVRYVVGGSVRKSGDRVRITVELVDAPVGNQLWSVHYDRNVGDILATQDDITQAILGSIEPELTSAEWAQARSKPPDNLDALDHYRWATWHLYRYTAADIEAAKQHCLMALECDRDFGQPYIALAYACHLSLIFDQVVDRDATLETGLRAAHCAVQLDDRDAFAHAILGRGCMMARDFDGAIAQTKAAIELNPYSAQAHYGLGFALVVGGDAAAALGPLQKAVDLSPRHPNLASFGTVLSTAHILLGNPLEAAHWARVAIRQPASHFNAYMHLAVALSMMGDSAGARRVRDQLIQLKPDFSPELVSRCWPFRRAADGAMLTEELCKLGA
jgi:TolB-like protein/DNA-binding winged helix-turn-helix (wHTH) protein/Flp pilus assembly protein TadD